MKPILSHVNSLLATASHKLDKLVHFVVLPVS